MMSVAARPLPGIRFERRSPPPGLVLPRMDVAAFVGIAAAGPLHTPVPVEDDVEFRALFGADAPLAWDAEAAAPVRAHLAPAVRAFFRNGGRRCWIVRVAGADAQSDVFEVPGLARLGAQGIEPARLQARSEGSWADGLRVAAALEASTLALVDGDGERFTFAVSRPGALVPGDLVRLRSDTDVVLFAVGSVGPAPPAASPLPGDRRQLLEVTARAGSVVRLLREPPVAGLAGEAAYRDDGGRAQTAPAIVAESGADRLVVELSGASVPAPAEGAWLRLDLGAEQLWASVEEVRGAEGVGSPTHDGLRVKGALVRPAALEPASYGPDRLAERLTFELWARRGATESWRLADLGFVPGHPRFAGDLPTDLDLYRSRDGERFEETPALWAPAAGPRFPLAAVGGDPAVLLPLGMGLEPSRLTGPLAAEAPALVRDGLEPFDARLFVDDALRDDGTRTVLVSADALRLEGARLRGIHALVGVDEPTIAAVPDAAQRRWAPAPDPDVPAPDELAPLLRPEWWRFLPCTPPTPEDRTAVAISEHFLCAGERIPGPPQLSASAPERGGFELRWTSVETPGIDYVLEEAGSPEWSDARVAYRGPATRRRIADRTGTRYHRVRAAAGDASSDWSNPVTVRVEPRVAFAVPEPEAGHFLACGTAALEVPQFDDPPAAVGGSYTLRWSSIADSDAVYAIEEAMRRDWSDARELRRGPGVSLQLFGRAPGVYYYRVRALVGRLSSDWSVGTAVLVPPAVRWDREPVDSYEPDALLAAQRALMRLCAARGDMLAVLALPEHYREDDAIAHAHALVARDPLDDDHERTASFAALYHPWLTAPEADDPQAFRISPPDGAAAGVIAGRAASRGAWIAPANEPLHDVVLLTPRLRVDALAALQEAQVNVVRQEPRGFIWLAADTLSPAADLRPIGVRRLLSLLRRVALLNGAGYVFEPNDATLHRAVQRGFEGLLGQLYGRGAFTGATADEAFRVVTDSSPNTPQAADAGRLLVQLKVAPSHPMAFLTVRLVQAGDGNLTVESR